MRVDKTSMAAASRAEGVIVQGRRRKVGTPRGPDGKHTAPA
jgi:hypothetical protein